MNAIELAEHLDGGLRHCPICAEAAIELRRLAAVEQWVRHHRRTLIEALSYSNFADVRDELEKLEVR